MIQIEHLETDITQACQLSCVGCNHSVPLYRARGPVGTTPEIVERDLARLAPIIHARRWGALGGEPTLSKHLVDILKIVRQSGICDVIEVWTNGLTIQRQGPEFWRAFDTLVVSRYPGKLSDQDVAWIRMMCSAEGKGLTLYEEHGSSARFQNMLDPEPSDAARTQRKFDTCFFKKFSRVVNNGYFFTCCCGPHLGPLLQDGAFGEDGISLDGITEDALRAYLERTTPLGACTICAGRDAPAARPLAWSEEKNPLEWVRKSKGL